LFVCLSVLHITVSLLRLYFDLCLFSCLFTLIVVFVIYCFVLPIVANKDLHKLKQLLTEAWFGIQQNVADQAIDQW